MRRLLVGLVATIAACTPGPRNPGTQIPLPPATPAATIAPVSGPAQQLVPGGAIDPRWWHAFANLQLDALVDAALAANNDLAAADATLRQATEQARATVGSTGPQVDANYQFERAKVSQDLSAPLASGNSYIYSLHTAQLTVAYPLDVFGNGRTRIRSARAAADVAANRFAAARATVVSNLVLAVIQHAALTAQIDAVRRVIADNRDLVALLRRRQALGDIGASDVAAQETNLATAEALLPPLQRQLSHQEGLLASLTGRPAGSPLPPLPAFADLQLPATLPVSLPAEIVARRPDVRAAEAQMRGAAADVGTAIAARLPQITLNGAGGSQALRLPDLFTSGNPFYTLIGGITQPLFHSGQLRHQQRAAEAALDVAKAQYRAAALQAFLDVDDALAGLKTDGDALDAAARAQEAASRTLRFTRRQVELGAVGTLQLLNASATNAQATQNLLQAKAGRLSDSVALFLAIGAQGGGH